MKKWENPELRDLSLKATKDVECPNKPEGANSNNYTFTQLPKEICCNCSFYDDCNWWWKYKGGCSTVS